jgi:hypothetical protein
MARCLLFSKISKLDEFGAYEKKSVTQERI